MSDSGASEKLNTIIPDLAVNDLQLYVELGNEAGKNGNMEESISWYKKGLVNARQTEDREKVKEFSWLIFSLL